MLEYVPAHFKEHVYHLAKYACGTCNEGVSAAPGPAKVIERSAADASVLAQVVVSNFADHTPLHRQHRIYGRGFRYRRCRSGWRAWPIGSFRWWMCSRRACSALASYAPTRPDSRCSSRVSADNIERGTMWSYVGDNRGVVFRYTPTVERTSGPWQFLAGRRGYVQPDAAGVFDRLFTGTSDRSAKTSG